MSITDSAGNVRRVTEVQREAIKEALSILLEDDRHRGSGVEERVTCAACYRVAGVSGSVAYSAEIRFCHACAIAYEVARVERRVRNCEEYVASRPALRRPEFN